MVYLHSLWATRQKNWSIFPSFVLCLFILLPLEISLWCSPGQRRTRPDVGNLQNLLPHVANNWCGPVWWKGTYGKQFPRHPSSQADSRAGWGVVLEKVTLLSQGGLNDSMCGSRAGKPSWKGFEQELSKLWFEGLQTFCMLCTSSLISLFLIRLEQLF